MTKLLCLLQSEKAATAIEYGLIAALICIGGIVSLQAFGNSATGMWNTVQTKSVDAMK